MCIVTKSDLTETVLVVIMFLTSLLETIQRERENSLQFCGFLSSVYCISSRTVYTERTNQQPQCERQFEEVSMELGREKVSTWEDLFVHRNQNIFLSVYVDDIKMYGKRQNMAPDWKKLMKNVDLDEPTPFRDEHLGCTQRECKPNEIIIEQFQEMFESYISAGATEKLKCVERYCELANKETEQLYNVSSPCLERRTRISWRIVTSLLTNKLSYNACTWPELVDHTFSGQSTN